MNISLITVPYDSGHLNERMGAGPAGIINAGLTETLEASGHNVKCYGITSELAFNAEVATAFHLIQKIAFAVSSAATQNNFIIVLSGNCNAGVGTVAGLSNKNIGIIWFDAHGDCETPDTTLSGFLDGMAISMIMGNCWQNVLNKTEGYFALAGKMLK